MTTGEEIVNSMIVEVEVLCKNFDHCRDAAVEPCPLVESFRIRIDTLKGCNAALVCRPASISVIPWRVTESKP